MKLFVVSVFSLAMVWIIAKYCNVGATAFTLVSVPVSYSMLIFCVGLLVGYKWVKR